MALIRADRVCETTTTTGTGALTLAAAVAGYRRFSAVMSTSDTCYYTIEAIDGSGLPTGDWETGIGTYSSANTLTRTTVQSSSNSNAAVSFAAGTKRVFIDLTAAAVTAIGGAPGALIFLEQHSAASSSTLDFTSFVNAAYDEYLIEFVGLVPSTNSVAILMRMSTDGGATYDAGGNYSWTASGVNRFGRAQGGADSAATSLFLNSSSLSNSSTASFNGTLRLFNPASTSLYKAVTGTSMVLASDGTTVENDEFAGFYRSATAVNAVRFLPGSGNFVSGTIRIYGIATTPVSPALAVTESLVIALGDEITTGTAKVTFRMPYAFVVTGVRASLTTASSSGLPTFDINEAGVSILSTKLTIDATEKTSTTAATPAVLSDTILADDAEITIDVDVAGTGAAGAKIYIIGHQ